MRCCAVISFVVRSGNKKTFAHTLVFISHTLDAVNADCCNLLLFLNRTHCAKYMKRDLILCMALIWVTGPSGAGKSTLGTFLRDKHQVAHILTHDMDMEIILSESSSFTQQKNGNPETRVQCHS